MIRRAAAVFTLAATAFGFEQEDKVGHGMAGAVIGLGTYGAIESLPPPLRERLPKPWRVAIQLATPAIAGAAKEWLVDRRADWRDAAATGLGGVLAVRLTWRF